MVSADVAIAECLDDRCCVRQPQPARLLELLFTSGPVFREDGEASTDEPGLALPSESLSVGLSVVTSEESTSGPSVYTTSW